MSASTHLIKESAVIDVATELRKLVLQDLLKLKTTRLRSSVTRRDPAATRSRACAPALSSRRWARNMHRRANSRLCSSAIVRH